MPDSFALALYWSFENEDKAILEELRSARTGKPGFVTLANS